MVWILGSEFWKPSVIVIAASFSCYVCCLHSQYVCYGSTTSTPLFAREIMTVKHVLGVIAAAYAITSSFFMFFLLL
ncbi:hypothetical protein YC2023_017515 [Brassica napus]